MKNKKDKLFTFALALPIVFFLLPAHANEIARTPFSFHDSFDFPAGSVCDFNYHGEFAAEGVMVEQSDAEGVRKIIIHQFTVEEIDQNVDTGYTLTGTGHQVQILGDFAGGEPGHIMISGQNFHLRDSDGHLVVHHAGHLSLDIATDTGKVTPNFGPHFDEVICPALGGHFRQCGDLFCGFEEDSEDCPVDCGTCNSNGVCEPVIGESHISCSGDCSTLCNVGEILCHDGTSCGRVCDGTVQCSGGLFVNPSFNDEFICGNCPSGTSACPSNPEICIIPCEGGGLSNVEVGGGSQFSCDFGNFPTEESTLFCGGCGDGICQSTENSTTCPADCP